MRRYNLAISCLTMILSLSLAACKQQNVSANPTSAPIEKTSPLPKTAPLSYAGVVDRVAPAVVTIHASHRVKSPEQFPFLNDPFFRQFFGRVIPNRNDDTAAQVEQALGSGVIVAADGHILTNQHVVDGAEAIKIDLNDRRSYSATLVGADRMSDLALLKIDARNLPVLTLGNSESVRVGDICLAVGNPLGIGETVTSGIVSAKGRATGLSNGSFEDFIQTDAPINQGNSGGALVNTTAELIGINSQILTPNGGNIGIGFAIPSNMAKNVMDQLIRTGKVLRGQLGVTVQPVTSDLAAVLGLKDVRGVLVKSVIPGGPADKSGIRPGDVIVAMNGTPIEDANAFRNQIASTQPGTTVTMTVLRQGREKQITARLGEFVPQQTS